MPKAGSVAIVAHMAKFPDPPSESTARLLLWAANFRETPPDELHGDVHAIADSISAHRLVGRTLDKLGRYNISFDDTDLVDELRKAEAAWKSLLANQVAALQDLERLLPDRAGPVIVLKGPSIYAATGDLRTQRHADDLDILPPDGHLVGEALLRAGYIKAPHKSLHEWLAAGKSDVEFDVHRYFPIWHYSQEITIGSGSSSGEINMTPLQYDLCRENSIYAKPNELGRITVPNLTMSALICCTNMFKDYTRLWSNFTRAALPFRLGDLAEMASIANRPEFDQALFLQLVDKLNARDAVNWTNAMIRAHGSSGGLPTRPDDAYGRDLDLDKFPRGVWDFFWSEIPQGGGYRWARHPTIVEIGDRVGVSKVRRKDAAALQVESLSHILSTTDREVMFSLSVRWNSDALTITIEVPPYRPSTDRFRVDLGGRAITEWTYDSSLVEDGPTSVRGLDAVRSADRRAGGGYSTEIVLSDPAAMDLLKGENVMVFVGLARTDLNGNTGATLAPMQITHLA